MLFARLFKFIVFLAFGINLLLLLLALSARYIDPKYFWPPSLFGLFFRVFLVAHLFFILIFLIGRKRRLIWISSIALVMCLPAILHTFALRPFSMRKEGEHTLKLMTYNVNDFNMFQDTATSGLIGRTMKKENPDIVCFQEYSNQGKKAQIIPVMLSLGYKYYYEYVTEEYGQDYKVGQAIFSKIPFINVQPIPFHTTANGAFSADFPIGKDTVRLFNIHFQSITLREHEMKIPTSLNDFKPPQKYYYRMLFVKMMWAFRKRSFQALKVREYMDRCKYKMIVCGDFNDTPLSFTYRQMTEKLGDSFLRSNFGMGSTFGGRVPLQRIDYILTDPAIETGLTRVVHCQGSDHFPVVTSFWLN